MKAFKLFKIKPEERIQSLVALGVIECLVHLPYARFVYARGIRAILEGV